MGYLLISLQNTASMTTDCCTTLAFNVDTVSGTDRNFHLGREGGYKPRRSGRQKQFADLDCTKDQNLKILHK